MSSETHSLESWILFRRVRARKVAGKAIYLGFRWLPDLKAEELYLTQYHKNVADSLVRNPYFGLQALYDDSLPNRDKLLNPETALELNDSLPSCLLGFNWVIDDCFDSWLSLEDFLIADIEHELPLRVELLMLGSRATPPAELVLDRFTLVGAGRSISCDTGFSQRAWGGVLLDEALHALEVSEKIEAIAPGVVQGPAWLCMLSDCKLENYKPVKEASSICIANPELTLFGRPSRSVRLCHDITARDHIEKNHPTIFQNLFHEIREETIELLERSLPALCAYDMLVCCPSLDRLSRHGEIIDAELSTDILPFELLPHYLSVKHPAMLEYSAADCSEQNLAELLSSADTTASSPLTEFFKFLECLHWPEEKWNKEHDSDIYAWNFLSAYFARYGYLFAEKSEYKDFADQLAVKLNEILLKLGHNQFADMEVIYFDSVGRRKEPLLIIDPSVSFSLWFKEQCQSVLSSKETQLSALLRQYNKRSLAEICEIDLELHKEDCLAESFAEHHNNIAATIARTRYCNPLRRSSLYLFSRAGREVCLDFPPDSPYYSLCSALRVQAIDVVSLNKGALSRQQIKEVKSSNERLAGRLFPHEGDCIVESLWFDYQGLSYCEPVGPVFIAG